MEAVFIKLLSYIIGTATIVALLFLLWALDKGTYKNKYDDFDYIKQRNSWKSLIQNTFISLKHPKDETGKALLLQFKNDFAPCFPQNSAADTKNIYYQIIDTIVSTNYAPMSKKQRHHYLVELTISKLKFATLQDLSECKEEYSQFLYLRIKLIIEIINWEIQQNTIDSKRYLPIIDNLINEYTKIYGKRF